MSEISMLETDWEWQRRWGAEYAESFKKEKVDWDVLLQARYTLALMKELPSYAWYGRQWQELGDLFMNLTGSNANASLCWAKAKEYISRQAPRMPDGSLADRDELHLGAV